MPKNAVQTRLITEVPRTQTEEKGLNAHGGISLDEYRAVARTWS
jgi:hypothetical protein